MKKFLFRYFVIFVSLCCLTQLLVVINSYPAHAQKSELSLRKNNQQKKKNKKIQNTKKVKQKLKTLKDKVSRYQKLQESLQQASTEEAKAIQEQIEQLISAINSLYNSLQQQIPQGSSLAQQLQEIISSVQSIISSFENPTIDETNISTQPSVNIDTTTPPETKSTTVTEGNATNVTSVRPPCSGTNQNMCPERTGCKEINNNSGQIEEGACVWSENDRECKCWTSLPVPCTGNDKEFCPENRGACSIQNGDTQTWGTCIWNNTNNTCQCVPSDANNPAPCQGINDRRYCPENAQCAVFISEGPNAGLRQGTCKWNINCQCDITTNVGVCGDGVLQKNEQCDDGNIINGDGCSATCQDETISTPQPVCGDGNLDTGEDCDDRNTVSGDGCSATCQTESSACSGGSCSGNQCSGESCLVDWANSQLSEVCGIFGQVVDGACVNYPGSTEGKTFDDFLSEKIEESGSLDSGEYEINPETGEITEVPEETGELQNISSFRFQVAQRPRITINCFERPGTRRACTYRSPAQFPSPDNRCRALTEAEATQLGILEENRQCETCQSNNICLVTSPIGGCNKSEDCINSIGTRFGRSCLACNCGCAPNVNGGNGGEGERPNGNNPNDQNNSCTEESPLCRWRPLNNTSSPPGANFQCSPKCNSNANCSNNPGGSKCVSWPGQTATPLAFPSLVRPSELYCGCEKDFRTNPPTATGCEEPRKCYTTGRPTNTFFLSGRCALCLPAEENLPDRFCPPEKVCRPGGDPALNRCVDCFRDEHCHNPRHNPPRPNRPNTPACKVEGDTGTCVRCTCNAHCANEQNNKICKPQRREGEIAKCVECLENTDCSRNPTRKACGDDSCVGCTADADCRTLYLNGAAAPKCALENDAPEGFNNDLNKCFQCLENEDCFGLGIRSRCVKRFVPNLDLGTCVQCTSDDECANGRKCNLDSFVNDIATTPPRGTCVECVIDAHCANRPDGKTFCDTPRRVCIIPPRNPVNACGDGTCNDSEDCSSCESDCGVCPPPPPPTSCTTNSDCTGGQACSNGSCQCPSGYSLRKVK